MKLINQHDPRLRTIAEEWDFTIDHDPDIIERDLIQIMNTKNGRGIAANQVGLLKRILVLKLESLEEPFGMFNPVLIGQSGEMTEDEEGCLSFPGLFLMVTRPQKVTAEYFDKSGKSCTIELSGIDARCFLHELDHLNGICFTDKISKLKLSIAERKKRKLYG